MNTETPSTPWYVWVVLGLAAGYVVFSMSGQSAETDDELYEE